MPVSRVVESKKRFADHDAAWYGQQRHENEQRNMALFNTDGWRYCDPDSFYRSLFPQGTLQAAGDDADGKGNIIVLEDTGKEIELGVDEKGNKRRKRVMHRYTVHDDLTLLKDLRLKSVEENTFMFLAPISYYGKSRSARNARYLHAIMIDLDFVGEQQLANLLHQMKHKVIPHANYLVSSGTGLHVIYKLDHPVPLMTRYVPGLQVLKRELTNRVWNAHTSASDPEKKQVQGIFQGFRMVGSMTKLNGAIGSLKMKKPYEVVCFSHDMTFPATIPYLLSFIPKLKDKQEMESLDALQVLTQEVRTTTPIAEAKEKWPEWYEKHVVNGEERGGWQYGRAAYDRVLSVIKEQASVSHRYWCIVYLAVMANKCGVSYNELEDDAYDLLERFDALSVEPGNRFTANDVAAALEAYEGGSAAGKARRYTQAFCERKAAVAYGEKMGHGSNPPEKRLSKDQALRKARFVRDLNQEAKGTHWWDNGNRAGAPKKAMQVWGAAYRHPNFGVAAIARVAGVSRPTVYKWLSVDDWREQYESTMDLQTADVDESRIEKEIQKAEEEWAQEWYAPGGGFDHYILETVATCPWKDYEEIAAICGVSSNDVALTVEENKELYNQILLGGEAESMVE